jgi:hypothetical protein
MVQYGGVMPRGITDPELIAHLPEDMRVQSRGDYDPKRDQKLLVRFYQDVKFMGAKSAREGRVRLLTTDYVAIRTDEYSEIHHEVGFQTDADGYKIGLDGNPVETESRYYWRTRFPEHWKEYQLTIGGEHGTPLRSYPHIDPAEIGELNAMKVYTCEAFAKLSDTLLTKMGKRDNGGSWVDLRDQVLAHLKQVGIDEALAKQKEAAEREAIELRQQLKELERKFQAMQDKKRSDSRRTSKAGGPVAKPITDSEGLPI